MELKRDLQLIYDWYEDQQLGLGESLLKQIDQVLHQVVSNPNSFQKRYKSTRISFTKKFPFGVHYLIDNSTIYILAILHTSRDPINWKRKEGE